MFFFCMTIFDNFFFTLMTKTTRNDDEMRDKHQFYYILAFGTSRRSILYFTQKQEKTIALEKAN